MILIRNISIVTVMLYVLADTACVKSAEDIKLQSSLFVSITPGQRDSSSLSPSELPITLKLCNTQKHDVYLPRFYAIDFNLKIMKWDSANNGWINYTSSYKEEIAKEFWENAKDLPRDQYIINPFLDSVASAITDSIIDSNISDTIFVFADVKEDFYFLLESFEFLKANECIEENAHSFPLEKAKGRYKMFVNYSPTPIPMSDSVGSKAYRFMENSIPKKLGTYERWEGKVVSDTIDFEF